MIRVENVAYSYGGSSVLEDLSFRAVESGITLMKLLAGHERPNKGIVEIKGTPPYNRPKAVQHVWYLQEDHPFSSLWSVKDALRYGSYYYSNWDGDLAQRLLKNFRLNDKKRISKLSKGMKSALQFIIGISSHGFIDSIKRSLK